MFYCYKRYIGVRRHSTGEMLWVAPKENELICSRFPEKEVVIAYHYYAGAERGKYDGEELICSVDCCGQYGTNTYPRGEYHVGVYNVPCLKEIFAIFPCEDVEKVYIYEPINPKAKDYQEWFLGKLDGETPESIREYFPDAHYVVTRSSQSSDYPWKREGRRTYSWVVPLEKRDADKGRRIEWGGDTILYPTRRAALNALYGGEKKNKSLTKQELRWKIRNYVLQIFWASI